MGYWRWPACLPLPQESGNRVTVAMCGSHLARPIPTAREPCFLPWQRRGMRSPGAVGKKSVSQLQLVDERDAGRQIQAASYVWFDDFDYSQVEIMRELQEDTSSQFISSEVAESQSDAQQESIINKLISAVYSGPTISDIESALSLTFQSGDSNGRCSARPMYFPKPFLLRLHSAQNYLVLVR
ncbi:hypothetical protein B296_00019828 [Ensete ventricosum]|uniref:Uncharacterized protein n=1 Tax=Ensete ventricosum TaxID=4639 RepID=A0A426ZDK6_ENSVE|nr:hypothetical protein B296_00019828 [Ensete ventricosum]